MTLHSAADAALIGAWAGSLLLAWTRPGRRPPASLVAGLLVLGVVVLLGRQLDQWTGGRAWGGLLPTTLGLALLACGTLLHAAARSTLGAAWSPERTPGAVLVTSGPYAHIRHPAYAGLLVMAIGTLLAHGSASVTAALPGLTVGLVMKARGEDQLLAERFGDAWRRYYARVPGWVPLVMRPGRPR